MKASEFRKLIREEVRRVVKEVGDNPDVETNLDPNAIYIAKVNIGYGGGIDSIKKAPSGNAAEIAKKFGHKLLKVGEGSFIDYSASSDTAILVGKPSSTNPLLKKFWTRVMKGPEYAFDNETFNYVSSLVDDIYNL
jgi:hypothetical protein